MTFCYRLQVGYITQLLHDFLRILGKDFLKKYVPYVIKDEFYHFEGKFAYPKFFSFRGKNIISGSGTIIPHPDPTWQKGLDPTGYGSSTLALKMGWVSKISGKVG